MSHPAPACAPCNRIANRPLVIADQGGDGERPSNTMIAFKQAVAVGVDMLEMDIHASSDAVIVLSHDDTLDRGLWRQRRRTDENTRA